MICPEYNDLSHIEKVTFIGALVHAVQSDSKLFEMAQGLIEIAKAKGIFDTVTIMPDNNENY